MSRSFSRDKRLLLPDQFKSVFDSPSGKVPGRNVLLLVRENGLDRPRLGFVIGKKSVKLAVERNRIRRQFRESFRMAQDQLIGWDIVVVARRGLADLDNSELAQQCNKFWKRIGRSSPSARTTSGQPHA